MTKIKYSDHKKVIRKKTFLDKINTQLKCEFIGIDKVIDEITDAVSAWYIFPEIQDKPVVVNLWGLTGVGKTSLVKRLSELLSFQNCFYRFDMGEVSSNEWAIRSQLKDLYDYRNGKPVILVFDEFQNARTKDGNGKEINNPATRIIWDLLDSGRFYTSRYIRGIDILQDLIKDLLMCLKLGVKVKNGLVVDRKEVFIKIMKLEGDASFAELEKNNNELRYCFVQGKQRDKIYEWTKGNYEHITDFNKELNILGGNDTINFLYDIYENSFAPVEVNCSKALLFVMGNLDEAYSMSGDFNPDMNADDFHRDSLKISITNIKNVLRKHFRNEQIARLGNIHIIYPAFNRASYQSIIAMELNRVSKRLWDIQRLKLEFDDSAKELIYQEGVYPTQGTRPLFTTIHQIIKSKLPKIVCYQALNSKESNRVRVSYSEESIHFRFYKGKMLLNEFSEKVILNLEVLRREKRNDAQTIVAVHESGHALVSALLERKLPERIFSSTVDSGLGGFVYISRDTRFMSKKGIKLRLATVLGGYAAEMIVFGEENITLGSESDIEKATKLVLSALKNSGMGSLTMQLSIPHPDATLNLCYSNQLIEEEAKEMIKNSLSLAKEILSENKLLLLKLSDYLSDNRCIEKEDLRKMILTHAGSKVTEKNFFIENEDDLFYRNHLKKALECFPEVPLSLSQINSQAIEFSLNKSEKIEKVG